MSEKVTFQELIESIAEESDNSKQFTHDFLKDFVDVINNGLEEDGNVNIAGFGKFKLRFVEEREGYNPQTEEKMTIPAHNKVVFKPYKGIRELVNAPYSHLEPQLIEKDEDGDPNEEAPAADHADETSSGESDSSSGESEGKTAKEKYIEEDPFGFEEMSSKSSSTFSLEEDEEVVDEEEDVVEFKPDTTEEETDETEQDLEEFIGSVEETEDAPVEVESTEDSPDQDEEEITEENTSEPIEEDEKETESEEETKIDSPFASVNTKSDKDATGPDDKEKQKDDTQILDRQLPDRKDSSSLPIIAAAISILVLIAVGAWYFGVFSTESSSQMAAQQAISSAQTEQQGTNQKENTVPSSNNDSQSKPSSSEGQQQPAQKQAANKNTQKKNQSTSSASQQKEQHAIAEGQTLWSIAEDKYGNPRLWPWIYGKNGSLNDPDLIIAGSSLTVPLPSGPQNSLTTSDSTGVAKGFLATYKWYKKQQSPKAKNHLWGAKVYYNDIRNLADIPIDEADLSYANKAR
ncbi:HU family DNA-binding protein [Fodinibius halophilus]|uniref:LysM domain-containing protein n=1 Tax=Fodinibius halophilus TaxID=1736908 RepID=A0A6M1THL2_9BACT|nr:HU family DNA-binding protein [Fodinibius halophilus]NGP88140.1 hypothetical protein [Fodinibius halophilus]